MDKKGELLRQYEALRLCESVPDGPVRQFMEAAYYEVFKRYLSRETFIDTDFDVYFFMEVMRDLFSQQDLIVRILNGENVRWMPDDWT